MWSLLGWGLLMPHSRLVALCWVSSRPVVPVGSPHAHFTPRGCIKSLRVKGAGRSQDKQVLGSAYASHAGATQAPIHLCISGSHPAEPLGSHCARHARATQVPTPTQTPEPASDSEKERGSLRLRAGSGRPAMTNAASPAAAQQEAPPSPAARLLQALADSPPPSPSPPLAAVASPPLPPSIHSLPEPHGARRAVAP